MQAQICSPCLSVHHQSDGLSHNKKTSSIYHGFGRGLCTTRAHLELITFATRKLPRLVRLICFGRTSSGPSARLTNPTPSILTLFFRKTSSALWLKAFRNTASWLAVR